MRRRHLRAILAIEAQVYPRPWSSRLFEDELERGGRVYLVARVGPTVVGYAGLLMIADDGHVATVAVDPVWQGHRVATRLLAELVRQSQRLGANQLTLEVRMSNVRAQGLYRRFGFAPAGARKGYYGDNGEDALVMWAHEIGSDDYQARLDAIDADLVPATARLGFDAPVGVGAGAGDGAHPASSRGRMERP
ncbi:ribosomal protein S18-alanine N-acetyltransferase [Aquihabitans sp. G128]|uniref:ribosomal protein S18-alanine N-acetyltransferase n=1 Tax=Aquihabitans sp. G128 TaxID=2849779 RepID=UPI001C23DC82|nr:ribosomal protein S18-alanine N-acetyltransferase [Aquihabitans sp. G128]QXC60353.1 ribosomal protein S18-alanine N-acetyltransferase [Aquihabitans sp. G128]